MGELATTKELFVAMDKVCHAAAAVVLFLNNKGMSSIPIVRNLNGLLLDWDVKRRRFEEEVAGPVLSSTDKPS